MNDLRRWATLILALALIGMPLAGCASKTTDTEEVDVVEVDVVEEMAPVDQMDGLRDRAARAESEQGFLVQHFIQKGDAFLERGDYAQAQKAYANALELAPDNTDAKEKIDRVGRILGERLHELDDVYEDARTRRMVKIQQARVQVESLWEKGQRLQAEGRFDEAVQSYERAAVIQDVFTYDADFTPNREGLKQQIAMAKREKAEAEKARIEREIAEARKVKEAEALREKKETAAQVALLVRDANVAFANERYEQAENFANEIMRLDPRNSYAMRLKDLAVRSRQGARNDALQRRNAEEWKKTFEDFNAAIMPQVRDVIFSDDFAARHGSKTSAGTIVDPTLSARDQEIHNILETTRVNLLFDGTHVQEALAFLHQMTGLNVILDPAVQNEMDDAELEVNVTVEGIAAKNALDLIAELTSLKWKIENGVVFLTTEAGARSNPVLRLYDVRDLVTPIRDFAGEEINLTPSGMGGSFDDEEFGEEPEAPFETDAIVELIRTNVDQPSWDDDNVDIQSTATGTLIVKQSPEVHAKIAKLLQDLRASGGLQVSIETRFVTVSDNFLQDIGVDLRGLGDQANGLGANGRGPFEPFDDLFSGSPANPTGRPIGVNADPASIGTGADSGIFYNNGSDGDVRARLENLFDVALGKPGVMTNSGGTSVQYTFLDDTQIEAILRAVDKSERTEIVVAPKITVYNNERANVTVLTQISYVYDFDVEIAQAAQIGDPLIQTIRDGVVLDVRPIISANRKYITMELRPTVATLVRPIATFQTTLANGPPVTIQLPELQIQRVRTTVTMPDGGTLLLGGLKQYTEQNKKSTAPWLEKIPLVSFFFTRQGQFVEKKHLLILIKAKIIDLDELAPTSGGGVR